MPGAQYPLQSGRQTTVLKLLLLYDLGYHFFKPVSTLHKFFRLFTHRVKSITQFSSLPLYHVSIFIFPTIPAPFPNSEPKCTRLPDPVLAKRSRTQLRMDRHLRFPTAL